MDNLFTSLKDYPTEVLVQECVKTSTKIEELRDTPFHTIREMEEISSNLEIWRIYLQAIANEMKTRPMTPEVQQAWDKALSK